MFVKTLFATSIVLFSLFGMLLFPTSSFGQENTIPSWIKNNAEWWADDLISDQDFISGIEYLIQNNIIIVPSTVSETSSQSEPIPTWIKNNAEWWADDLISDQDFVLGIQHLISINLISVESTTQYLASTNLPLMIPILNAEDPKHDIDILKKYMKSGDIVPFPPKNYVEMSKLKKEIPGLELATGGITIDTLLDGISRLPPDVKYITYDYEPSFSPEFTSDQNDTIELFKQLHAETKNNNQQLVVAPVYVFGEDWDWGEIAKYTDIIIVQVQNFQTDAQVPSHLLPSYLGIDMKGVAEKIVNQVKEKSPSTKIFFQIGFEVTHDPENLLADIEILDNTGIDGITLWYNPGTSGSSSKVDLLDEVLSKLERTD